MAIQIQGNGGVVAEVDGTTFRALRVTARPVDYGTLGHYSFGGFTGILPAALAANSEILQFRWADATRLCLVRRVRMAAAISTTYFGAGVPVQVDAVKATSWTVAGTGGTGITVAATLKRRTSMGSSLLVAGDLRIATTAALGAGTKTLEANSIGAALAGGPQTTATNGTILAPTELLEANLADGGHPPLLVTNEGFVVRSVAVPATGTWTASFSIDWAELTAF